MSSVVHRPRLAALLSLAAILLVAAALRFAGLDWDRGHFAHPDERRILMVVEEMHWPQPCDWSLVLSPHSPLNPRFFAYGSLPLYLLRLLGALTGSTPAQLYLPGRILSATIDLLTVAALYAIGRRLAGRRVGLLASAFLACSVLSIQLAHYLTVESLLTLLCTLTLWCLLRVARSGSRSIGLLAGALTGLALATKTSALPLLFAGWVAWALWALAGRPVPRLGPGVAGLASSTAATALAFLLAQPYAILDWFRFVAGVLQEGAMASGAIDLPYTRQFAATPPYLYQARQLVLWSLGLPLGLLALAALFWLTWRTLRSSRFGPLRTMAIPSPSREHLVILAWVWPYLLATGALHAKFLRYMAPVIPWLCLMAALFLAQLWQRAAARPRARRAVAGLAAAILTATFLYALAFITIYLRPHPWLAANAWLHSHLPPGAVLTAEEWDDRLPIAGPTNPPAPAYQHLDLDIWGVDSPAGLDPLAESLARADYVVEASQRLYGAIGRLPQRAPLAAAYYHLLFSERLGFRLAHVETSYPRLGPLAIVDEPLIGTTLPRPALPQPAPLTLTLGRADESYSVYDHPRVLIFQKHEALSPAEIKARIVAAAEDLARP